MHPLRSAISTPLRAFGCAFLGCLAYFTLVFAGLSMQPNGSKHLGGPAYVLMLALPALASAALLMVGPLPVRGSTLRAMQAVVAAILAPILAWYLIGFAFVVATGEGF